MNTHLPQYQNQYKNANEFGAAAQSNIFNQDQIYNSKGNPEQHQFQIEDIF